jgi:hypothetical protein
MDPDDVADAIKPANVHFTRTAVVAVENTHNGAGGTVLSPEDVKLIADVAHAADVPVHMDGARVFNAAKDLMYRLRSRGAVQVGELVDSGVIYPRKKARFKRVFDYFEENMLRKLLEFLESVGCVSRGLRGYRVTGADCLGRLDELRERIVESIRGSARV